MLTLLAISMSSCDVSGDAKKICDCYDKIQNISDLFSQEKYCVQLHVQIASKYLEEPEKASQLDSIVKESKRAMVSRISKK